MEIFNGKKTAEKILSDLKIKIRKLRVKPTLATILVGEDRASKLYIKLKKKAAQRIGAKLVLYKFKSGAGEESKFSSSTSFRKRNSAKEEDIIHKIESLNENKEVQGIIVQLPLPKGFNAKKITGKISRKKDVDGFQQGSYFPPVLPSAILIALREAIKSQRSKKFLALVNSRIFGKTLKRFLKKERIRVNYILRKELTHSKLKTKLNSADVIITACGIPNLIKNNMVKRGVVLIDAGITRLPGKKVLGDVDKKSVKDKASFLTPVPGGIGPLSVALLLKNTYLAVKKHGKRS